MFPLHATTVHRFGVCLGWAQHTALVLCLGSGQLTYPHYLASNTLPSSPNAAYSKELGQVFLLLGFRVCPPHPLIMPRPAYCLAQARCKALSPDFCRGHMNRWWDQLSFSHLSALVHLQPSNKVSFSVLPRQGSGLALLCVITGAEQG